MGQNYIVGIGEVLWDILPNGMQLGGAPANFAYHASQFGLKSKVVSAIGNDQLGNEILNVFQNKNIDALIQRVDYPTGTVDINLNANGIPLYNINENVAWDNIHFTPELKHLAENTCAVSFGSLAQRNHTSKTAINDFLDSMPNRQHQYKVFDINLRQHFYSMNIIHDSLERCNILKITDEELETIGHMFDIQSSSIKEKCLYFINKYGLEMLILTCGINGSYIFTSSNASFLQTPTVKVADTVGAGDSFTASFISSILTGKSIEDSHNIAVKVSAYVCTQRGAMPKLPNDIITLQ